jgi:hypothetical protein
MHCMCMQRQRTRRHWFSRFSAWTSWGQAAGAAANGTPRGAAARSRCGEPGVLRISGIFWNSGRPHAPGGPMQGPQCRAARERGARCVTDIWYFEIPGGHAHPGAPRPPGPPGSGEPGVLRMSGILKSRAAPPGGPKAPRAASGIATCRISAWTSD